MTPTGRPEDWGTKEKREAFKKAMEDFLNTLEEEEKKQREELDSCSQKERDEYFKKLNTQMK